MLNFYRESCDEAKQKFRLLPMYYNWKAYWRLNPTEFSQVKILHFHGPKLGRGLEGMSMCIANDNFISSLPKPYVGLVRQGTSCDQGRTAEWSIKTIKNLQVPIDDLCENVSKAQVVPKALPQ